MSQTKLDRRKALARIGTLALAAYAVPTIATISKAHAKGGSSGGGGGGSGGGGTTGGSSTSGTSTSGESTSGTSTSGDSANSGPTKKRRRRKS